MANQYIKWQNDWARWRARDKDGDLYEYELKPHLGIASWVTLERSDQCDCVGSGAFCPHWRDTLEARPVESGEPSADSHDDGTLTGAALYRAIADAIDAGEGPAAFQVDRSGDGFVTAWSWAQLVVDDDLSHPIRRKPDMRSATLPDGEVVEWPAPMTTEPAEGGAVWVTCDTSTPHTPWYWFPYSAPELVGWLESGFCHASREARDQHERALVAISRGTTDAD